MNFQAGDRVKYYNANHDGDLGTILDIGTKDGETTYGVRMDEPNDFYPNETPHEHWGYRWQFEAA